MESRRKEGKVVKGAVTAALRATLLVSLLEESIVKPFMRRATAAALSATSRLTVKAGRNRAAIKAGTATARRGRTQAKSPRSRKSLSSRSRRQV